MVRTPNFQIPAARGSCARGSGTKENFFKFQPRVVVVRTQNILSPAALGSGTRGSGARGSGTNAKFSNSRRA